MQPMEQQQYHNNPRLCSALESSSPWNLKNCCVSLVVFFLLGNIPFNYLTYFTCIYLNREKKSKQATSYQSRWPNVKDCVDCGAYNNHRESLKKVRTLNLKSTKHCFLIICSNMVNLCCY